MQDQFPFHVLVATRHLQAARGGWCFRLVAGHRGENLPVYHTHLLRGKVTHGSPVSEYALAGNEPAMDNELWQTRVGVKEGRSGTGGNALLQAGSACSFIPVQCADGSSCIRRTLRGASGGKGNYCRCRYSCGAIRGAGCGRDWHGTAGGAAVRGRGIVVGMSPWPKGCREAGAR